MRAVAVVALVALLASATASPTRGDASAVSALPHGSSERVTPDYVEGPWFPLEAEQSVLQHTQRPRVVEALDLLRQVMESINEGTNSLVEARQAKLPTEERILADGRGMIEALKADIDEAKGRAEAFRKIHPTQASITDKIRHDLASLYADKAELHETEAEVRFPFADRLADYTGDLQNIIRAKVDAEIKLKEYMTPAELGAMLGEFTKLATEIQSKIDAEVTAANDILNPTSRQLADNEEALKSLQESLSHLRLELASFISKAQGYIPQEQHVKEMALHDEEHLLQAMERVVEAQDSLLAKSREAQEKQMSTVHHAAMLLSSMLVDDTAPVGDATQPALAFQRVRSEPKA